MSALVGADVGFCVQALTDFCLYDCERWCNTASLKRNPCSEIVKDKHPKPVILLRWIIIRKCLEVGHSLFGQRYRLFGYAAVLGV